MITEPTSDTVRAFLRSLNILLKSARMYGLDHTRTAAQFDDTWKHLQAALTPMGEAGLRLAVSGGRLLLDGAPLKIGPGEKGFVALLSAADLASITFAPYTSPDALSRFVRVFVEAGSKPVALGEQLKVALGGSAEASIRINEVRFVPTDSEGPEGKFAAALVAQTLAAEAEQLQGWLNDPNKLLQLIAAAEGARTGQAGGATGDRISMAPLAEEEFTAVIHLLSRLAQGTRQPGTNAEAGGFHQELFHLPRTAQISLQQVLAQFAAATPTTPVGTPLLLRLAQHLAIRLALERYERGEVRVDAISQLLSHLNQEIETLRKTLGTFEEKMKQVGLAVESPSDVLERQFWAELPESAKLEVLLSPEAWRIPAHNVRQHVEQLLDRGQAERVKNILLNYVTCIHSEGPEARRKTALGLNELAEHYVGPVGHPLPVAIGHIGDQLIGETEPDLQSLICASFVRLSQEAAIRRCYPALLQMMACLGRVEQRHPELAKSTGARIGLENRIPDFLEEALRVPIVPEELLELLRLMPPAAAEHVAGRLSRCSRRRERDRLVELGRQLGPGAASLLREIFRSRPPAAATNMVGLLSRLDLPALEEVLPTRLPEWNRIYHDAVVRQIASAGAPERGRLLVKLLDLLEPLVLPLAVDEIGMSGDVATAPVLLALAGSELPRFGSPYLRVKAVEALGRLREKAAVPLLRRLVETKQARRWLHPQELRIVAAQALLKIDPEGTKSFLPRTDLTEADLALAPLDRVPETPGVRQRYYQRIRLPHPLEARISTAEGEHLVAIRVLSLGGGLASGKHQIPLGTAARIRIHSGIRTFGAKIVLRDSRSEQLAFEIADLDLDDRTKLRSLLMGIQRRTA